MRTSGDDPIAPSGGKDDDDDNGGIDDAPPAVEEDATMDDSDGSTGKRGESLRRSRARGTSIRLREARSLRFLPPVCERLSNKYKPNAIVYLVLTR